MTKKDDLNILRTHIPFNIEGEIFKIKIPVPLTELVTQDVYKTQLLRALNIGEQTNSFNVTNDKLELLFGT